MPDPPEDDYAGGWGTGWLDTWGDPGEQYWPKGVDCTPGPFAGRPRWQDAVDPRTCDMWEHVWQTRPTWPEHRAAWDDSLARAQQCCSGWREWVVSRAKMEIDFSEDCLGFIQFLDSGGGGMFPESQGGGSTGPHLHALLNIPRGDRGSRAVKYGPRHKQMLYIETWKHTGHGNRTRFQMCRPDVVQWLRELYKTWETADAGVHPGRFTFAEPDQKAAADRKDKIMGKQARTRAFADLRELDRAVTASTERKKRTAAATLDPGECVGAWDGVVCKPAEGEEATEETTEPPPPPPPPDAPRLPLALILGIGGAVVGGPPGALGGAALGAWIQKRGDQ